MPISHKLVCCLVIEIVSLHNVSKMDAPMHVTDVADDFARVRLISLAVQKMRWPRKVDRSFFYVVVLLYKC